MGKSIDAELERGKRYMKTCYQQHCSHPKSKNIFKLADVVVDEFKKDEPGIKRLLTKSDNAGCYHGNYSAESVYNLCKKKNIQLFRYDFNEPCCRKDQCDRESAAAKNILRSNVDAENYILTAEDIHKSLHYGFGMKDSKVAVAQINNAEIEIAGTKITKLSNYHPIQFKEDHMMLWRYYDIGQGVKQIYGKSTIKPAIHLLVPYSKTDNKIARADSQKQKAPKKRNDRQLFNLQFCPNVGCTQLLETTASLEEHIMSGQHTFAKETSTVDKVKKMFVEKMKVTSQIHLPKASVDHLNIKELPK